MRRIEGAVLEEWIAADRAGERYFPHEFMYRVLRGGKLKKHYQIDPKNSWMLAACEKNLPIWVPGWEDATLGNMYAAALHPRRREERPHRAHRHRVHDDAGRVVHADREALRTARARSGSSRSAAASPATSRSASCRCCTRICSAPACRSGATSARSATRPPATAAIPARCRTRRSPGASSRLDTPKFIVESDATIVAPLIFAWVLGQ